MSLAFSVMGVVNATPDSFSDGGLYLDADAAIAHARELIAQGADIVDVGGESTRPGAEPVAAEEELRRVVPVVEGVAEGIAAGGDACSEADVAEGIAAAGGGAGGEVAAGGERGDGVVHGQAGVRIDGEVAAGGERGDGIVHGQAGVRISIDTSKAAVARAALDAGAAIVNDVTALRGDPEMAEVVATAGCECVLMHMLGEPRTMQSGVGGTSYEDVVDDVRAFLSERMDFAVRAGIREERIILDPGIGFGKTIAHNIALLRRLDELVALGRPVLVGTSRKSFIGRLIADSVGTPEPVDVAARLPGTIATSVLALARGASIFRVHDVAPVRAGLAVAAATLDAR